MGCCGDNKAVKQAIQIGVGTIKLTTDKMGITKRYKFTDRRIRLCRQCDESTWMQYREYIAWLAVNGIEVLENFSQLENLPKLPKYEMDNKRRNLYCRICKCYIPAKARVSDAKCPYSQNNKWSKI